jgi:hypothetical protein
LDGGDWTLPQINIQQTMFENGSYYFIIIILIFDGSSISPKKIENADDRFTMLKKVRKLLEATTINKNKKVKSL